MGKRTMREIQLAVDILEKNIVSIHTVKDWAEEMNFTSINYFSRKIRDEYGKRPKKIIIETKLKMIKEYLKKNDKEIFYSVALDLGFKNDISFYQFVKRHTGKSLSEFNSECKKLV